MSKLLLTCVAILFVSLSWSQKEISLKRKYFGKYKGIVSSYTYKEANKLIEVSETTIYVDLFKEEIRIKIGANEMTGSYVVMFEANDYYLVDAKMEGSIVTERIIVYKKGKRIGRDGIYPQPVSELMRYARK
ncbi:MAG: hypothetical protein EP333_01895 [Bacteroidetes bacterium]|nr:MAG: hypothetical protein EP333_01895 [Bacteroidota bacterium]TNE98081.1 MAG: hypothetical protein EP322_05580 [Bacteroidota bacterium]